MTRTARVRRRRTLAAGLGLVLLIGAGVAYSVTRQTDEPAGAPERLAQRDRNFVTDDPLKRGCALGRKLLYPIYLGHDPEHAEDLLMVPQHPNYSGTFNVNNHSGPWRYLQNVPLVLYGPQHIEPQGRIEGAASVVDIYPTVGRLTGLDLPPRDGVVLEEALRPGADPPKLIVTIVWDGVGRNVLERWPNAWPVLKKLEREGASYVDAVVGSSPSITPATHSSMGTGVYPIDHGVTGIKYRTGEGVVRSIFAGLTPFDLKVTTFADEIDQALGNESLVGLLAWRNWHLGLMSHGAAIPGGDNDQLALIGHDTGLLTNPAIYSMPDYLNDFPGLEKKFKQLDRADGEVDGEWMGHEIGPLHENPAWINYQSDILDAMLKREGYGADDVPDFFFTNFKMTDIVGHQYTMDSREERAVLHAQDAALGRLVDYLQRHVRDYVVILTADHGHTPSPERTGGWPIAGGRLGDDIDTHFDAPKGTSFVRSSTAVGLFLNRSVMKSSGVTTRAIAEFINAYTLADNGDGDIPEAYRDRSAEQLFSAAFPSRDLPRILKCAFGTPRPKVPS